MLKNPGLTTSVVHSAAKVTFTFISSPAVENVWFISCHFMSLIFHCKIFITGLSAVRCIRFDSQASLKFSGSFSTGHVVHSSAKIMFTYKIWFISYDKMFNFKHWTNVTPVGLHPRKKLQKRGCATFPANFLKLLAKAVSSHLAVILFGSTKISLIQFAQNSTVCVLKFWSLFLPYVMTDRTT